MSNEHVAHYATVRAWNAIPESCRFGGTPKGECPHDEELAWSKALRDGRGRGLWKESCDSALLAWLLAALHEWRGMPAEVVLRAQRAIVGALREGDNAYYSGQARDALASLEALASQGVALPRKHVVGTSVFLRFAAQLRPLTQEQIALGEAKCGEIRSLAGDERIASAADAIRAEVPWEEVQGFFVPARSGSTRVA